MGTVVQKHNYLDCPASFICCLLSKYSVYPQVSHCRISQRTKSNLGNHLWWPAAPGIKNRQHSSQEPRKTLGHCSAVRNETKICFLCLFGSSDILFPPPPFLGGADDILNLWLRSNAELQFPLSPTGLGLLGAEFGRFEKSRLGGSTQPQAFAAKTFHFATQSRGLRVNNAGVPSSNAATRLSLAIRAHFPSNKSALSGLHPAVGLQPVLTAATQPHCKIMHFPWNCKEMLLPQLSSQMYFLSSVDFPGGLPSAWSDSA